jgi:hypothetical protein
VTDDDVDDLVQEFTELGLESLRQQLLDDADGYTLVEVHHLVKRFEPLVEAANRRQLESVQRRLNGDAPRVH